MKWFRSAALVGAALILFLMAPYAAAQTVAGQISGLVTDPSGSAIAGASVVVTDIERNVNFRTESNERGFFVVTPLPPGRYRLRAEKQGFRAYNVESLPIATQQKAEVNIALQLGAVSESVTVTGGAQLVETTTATLSGVVENKRIIDLPLNGRNVYSLAWATAGVFPQRPANGNANEGFHSIGIFTVNGGRDSSNAIMMDGVPVTMNSNTANMNANSAVPSVEGVEEFRIQTNSYSAEYGRSGGGVLTIATKSGTNDWHGSLFEFMRNSKLDANNWFANASGQKLAVFQRNEFGASSGGPLSIPKLYNGKNRSFFFVVYEGRRQRSASTRFFTLPTDEQMNGDFSKTLTAAGQLRNIYDPFSTTPDPARPGQFLRTVFPGNRVPVSRFDPVAANVLKFYGPKPNLAGQTNTGQNNFFFQGKAPTDVNRGTGKFDHNFNESQRIFFRYTMFQNENSQPELWAGPGCPDGGCYSNYERQQNAALDYSWTLTPTTLVNLRYGFARSILDRGSWHKGFRPTTLGLPSYTETGADLLAFPEFSVEEMTMPGLLHHWNFRSANQSHTFVGTLSNVKGSHSLKYGSEVRLNLINHMQAPWSLNFTFNRGMTQGPDPRVVSANGGFGFASFLLGAGAGGSEVHGIRPALESKSYGFYIQDDWKVNRKLTVNLGLRWDFETGLTERHNRYAVFDPAVQSPLSQRTGLNLLGGWTFPLEGGRGRTLRSIEWGKIAPRIGLAYQVRPGLVIRTGGGIFYTMATYGANNYGTAPFRATTPWVPTIDGVTPTDLLRNPFPNGVLQPEGPKNGLMAALGQGVGSPVPNTMTTPYNSQWNFSIAQDLGSTTVLELAYAGNKGTKLPLGWQMDQLPSSLVRPDAGLLDVVPNPFFGIIPVGPLSTRTVQRGELLTPFPHLPGVSYAGTSWGNSNFHSLQATFKKRFSGGGTVVVAYTWSKLLADGGDNAWDAAGFRDFNCRACDKSVSPYHYPHRVVTTATYELPFGKGKKFGSTWKGFTNAVLGQWQVNGIVTLSSGQPLQMLTTGNTSFSFGGGQRPDSTGKDARLDTPTLDRWFDTAAFRLPAQYTFGNVGRMHPNLRADFVELLDLSVFKRFNVFSERVGLEFRAESFNAFNHPVFAAPNTTVGNAQFGRVTGMANAPRQTQLALKLLW
ncbi:MAG: TonB-dependent receptor [Acidobacteria bacterium]|nr:TonB-dependent receptor [Acidobacteriota bacterium]